MMYYRTASECPISAFISVLVYEDTRYLKTSLWVPKRALAKAWEDIFDYYIEKTNRERHATMLSRLKDAAILRNKARLAASLLEVLALKYNKDVVDVLKKLGYRLAFDPKNPEQYRKDLDRVASEVVRQTNLIKEIESQYRQQEKNKVKAEDFDKILAHLGKFQGYRLDPDKVTVSEFVEIMALYKESNKK